MLILSISDILITMFTIKWGKCTFKNILPKSKRIIHLIFGLVNPINTYLRLKNCVVLGEIFSLKCVLIEFARCEFTSVSSTQILA